jgi:hypothetical protein
MQRLVLFLLVSLMCISSGFSQAFPLTAILPLNVMGVSNEDVSNATTLLINAINQSGMFVVIEQAKVNSVIEAQSFTIQGNTDESYATEIGKLLLAEWVIIGSFSQVGLDYTISAKIVDIESKQSIKMKNVSFTSLEDLTISIDLLVNKLIDKDLTTESNSIPEITEEQSETEVLESNFKKYIFQFGLGSGYSFYFPIIDTAVATMDQSSLSRIPMGLELLFGSRMSDYTAWTISLLSGIDIFSSGSDFFQLYSMILSAGFQYNPFKRGLIVGLDAGMSMLIPNTNLSYIGSVEFGSAIVFNLAYAFDMLKFSKLEIVPGLGIKLIHSELFRGSVNLISGYINLAIR